MKLDGFLPPLLVLAIAAALIAIRPWWRKKLSQRPRFAADAGAALAIVCFTATLELAMGRNAVYQHGPIRLWAGDVNSDQNSQQFTDPYTFTHLVHGAVFYGLARVIFGSEAPGLRFLVVVAVEAAWEALENTDMVIGRYRAATIARGYYGDSILNSMSDILSCMFGFYLAWRLPAWATLAWVLALELALAFWIHDNLTLNVVMLIYPIQAIKTWQAGG